MTRWKWRFCLALGISISGILDIAMDVAYAQQDPMVFHNGVDESTDFCMLIYTDDSLLPLADDVSLPEATQISTVEWSGEYVGGLPAEHSFSILIYDSNLETALASFIADENDLDISQIGPARFVFSTNIDFTMEANEVYWVSIFSGNNNSPMFCWGSTTQDQDTGNAHYSNSVFNPIFLPIDSLLGVSFALHLTLFGAPPNQDLVFENVDFDNEPDASLELNNFTHVGADCVQLPTDTRVQEIRWAGAYSDFLSGDNVSVPGEESETFDISIRRDINGSPGAILVSLSDVEVRRQLRPLASSGSVLFSYNYAASIDFIMEANTNYWITVRRNMTDNFNFDWYGIAGGDSVRSTSSGLFWFPFDSELFLGLTGIDGMLFNNGPDDSAGGCAPSDPTFAQGNVVAENVRLLNRSRIQQIQWYGRYSPNFVPATDNFSIDIYLDDNGQPGDQIVSVPVGNNVNRRPIDSTQGDLFEYTADAVFNLAANTDYWISIRNSVYVTNSAGGFCWVSSIDQNGNALQSSDGGTTWNPVGFSGEMTLFLFGDPLPNETIVFDSGTGIGNADTHGFSDAITNSGPIAVADEVQVPVDTAVNQITWSGTYFSFFFPPIGFVPAPSIDDFTISIHADAGGQPAADPIVTFDVGNNVSRQQVPGPFTFTYVYTAEIDFLMEANTTYWVSIYENIASPTFASFCWSAQAGIGNSHFSSNGQPWQPGGSRFSILLLNTVPELSGLFEPSGLNFFDTTFAFNGIAPGEVEFFQIDFDGLASSLTIDTFGSNFDTEIGLYNSGGVLIAQNDNVPFQQHPQSKLNLNNLSAGTYYLAVSSSDSSFSSSGFGVTPGNAGGSLRINIATGSDPVSNVVDTFTVSGADFCDNDTRTLNSNSPYFYEVVYDGVFPLVIETFGSPNDINTEIALFDFDGNLIAENDDVLGNGSQLVFAEFSPLPTGTYFLAVAGSDTEFADGFMVNQLSADFTPGPVTVKVATRQAIPAVTGAFSPMGYQFADSDTVMLDPDGYVIYDLFYDGVAPLTIDTLASPDDVDTEIALYGTGPGRPVIAENDDARGTSQSKLFFDPLTAGQYNIVVSGHETQFFDNLFIYNVFTDFTPGLVTLSVTTDAMFVLGDVNCDGVVNLLDIEPFIDAISSGTFDPKADIDQNGVVNLLDVEPFIVVLNGG